MRFWPVVSLVAVGGSLGATLTSCSDTDNPGDPPATCQLEQTTFEVGDEVGHSDPFGAKSAQQARAGRIQASDVAQPAHGRQQIQDGDYVLVNDKIAVAIEAAGLSDGYARFGGEILAIDQVDEDGRMAGKSKYVETLYGLAIQMIKPTSVSVMNDGSDGEAAVVRVTGPVEYIPFMEEAFGAIFPQDYDLETAIDYVLEPGSEKLLVRIGVVNATPDQLDFGLDRVDTDEFYGFFQTNQNQIITASQGFEEEPGGFHDWIGFGGGEWGFAWRTAGGDPLEFGLSQSGFNLFWGPGWYGDACSATMVDHIEIIAGGPYYDGLREAIRRVDGEAAWRSIEGTVADYQGNPIAGAYVHELDAAGNYLSRTLTDADGAFTIHAPNESVELVPQLRGYPPHSGASVETGTGDIDLVFEEHGMIHVTASELDGGQALPVRIQVIPEVKLAATPSSYGSRDEDNGRLHQEFAVTGESTLVVPTGQHRVIVSRGYEWEIVDTVVTVAAGETAEIDAVLEHSIDTTDVMCADFHIHSFMSADSPDPIDHKLRGAIADGLDIPVSSEHEWIVDFQPLVKEWGLEQWAFGGSSQELTTFTWGHFGVVPIKPKDGALNRGAIDWVGKQPSEVFAQVDAEVEKPILIVNHPSGAGFGAYFSAAQLDNDTGTSTHALWSDNFDAVEVYNDSTLDDNRKDSFKAWSALLNAGMNVFAVGSSDSHKIRSSPVGYPRTCMQFGHDDPSRLSPTLLRDVLATGNSTISGGLYMTVVATGGERPGETITGAGEHAFTVTVQAPSWISVDNLEVIVNGETVTELDLMPFGDGTAQTFVNEVTVPFDAGVERSWVVFHARGAGDLSPVHPGRTPFAASNPIFVRP